ncbi:YdcF family protein [Sphingomicrobium clamense]|uniref:YdcF family protein n=1 Tax=Sphingomicrobium clamense TaxID=2851013 RepID=A0ABS6V2Z2_9SPHN|nr:YdcF family protein [Sphingomicrobium sp. B8]MBW0143911.1 YdcF family protein [Sphingomicrobium sp. B8]
MILRILALLALAYALGFAAYSVALGKPAPADSRETQAIVVLTGGSGRIEQAVERLEQGKASRLLIAGTDPSVREVDLAERLGGKEKLLECCITLGSESVDTRSNAEEAKAWLEAEGFDEVRLVTSDWHMRRAAFEFRRALGEDTYIVYDAVDTDPGFRTLFVEYNKYVLRRLGLLLGI